MGGGEDREMAEVLRDGGPRKREGGGARSGWRFEGVGGKRLDISDVEDGLFIYRSLGAAHKVQLSGGRRITSRKPR